MKRQYLLINNMKLKIQCNIYRNKIKYWIKLSIWAIKIRRKLWFLLLKCWNNWMLIGDMPIRLWKRRIRRYQIGFMGLRLPLRRWAVPREARLCVRNIWRNCSWNWGTEGKLLINLIKYYSRLHNKINRQ